LFAKVFAMMLTVSVAASVSTVPCVAQTMQKSNSNNDENLVKFLKNYQGSGGNEDRTTRYVSALVDLRDEGAPAFIIYLTGRSWCGSGGCTMLILRPEGQSYKVFAKVMLTRPPIRVLAAKSHGSHDIAVRVQGGGIVRAYEARLSFNGKSYPNNPTTLPARRLSEHVSGEIVVPQGAEGVPLYQ
jgi:hypothetical protein